MAHDRAEILDDLTRRATADKRKPPNTDRSTEDLAASLLLQMRFADICKPRGMSVTDIAEGADVERSHLSAVMYAQTKAGVTARWAAVVEPWFGLAEGSLMSYRDGGEWHEDLSRLDLPTEQEMLQAQLERIERKVDELGDLQGLVRELLKFRDPAG